MADILVYALHYDGAFNKNSLGAVSRGGEARAASSAARRTRSCSATARPTSCARSSGGYGASKVLPRAGARRAWRSRSSTRWLQLVAAHGFSYALFGGGLLGFEIGAGLAARLGAGVAMEVTAVRAEDGKLVAERPILGDSAISRDRVPQPESGS